MKSLFTNKVLGKSGLCLCLKAIQPQRKGFYLCGSPNAQSVSRTEKAQLVVTTGFIYKLISRRKQDEKQSRRLDFYIMHTSGERAGREKRKNMGRFLGTEREMCLKYQKQEYRRPSCQLCPSAATAGDGVIISDQWPIHLSRAKTHQTHFTECPGIKMYFQEQKCQGLPQLIKPEKPQLLVP